MPVIVNPNAGLPRSVDGRTVFDVGPEEFASRDGGTGPRGRLACGRLLWNHPGAHCGNDPALQNDLPRPPATERTHGDLLLFQGGLALESGRCPNRGTHRPNWKIAFQAGPAPKMVSDYVLREGIVQQQAGARVRDVNVGLPRRSSETAMMCRAVTELRSVVDLPLQIDTSDAETMEQAMRLYNGKPLINSVNGKQESMRQRLPAGRKNTAAW